MQCEVPLTLKFSFMYNYATSTESEEKKI